MIQESRGYRALKGSESVSFEVWVTVQARTLGHVGFATASLGCPVLASTLHIETETSCSPETCRPAFLRESGHLIFGVPQPPALLQT